MLEVTETQGKEIVSTMRKLGDLEDKKVAAAGDIADKQLEYFKLRDREIAANQRGLVQAVNGLSAAIVQACMRRPESVFDRRPLQRQHPQTRTTDGGDFGLPSDAFGNGGGSGCKARPIHVEDDEEARIDGDVDIGGPASAHILSREGTPIQDSSGHINIRSDDLL
jgi:hypothetical protein